MNASFVTWLDVFNTSDNSSDAAVGFPYESMEVFYQRQLPTVMALNRYITIIWYVVGFPGNFLALVVWIQPRMRHSSGCYLAALAAADCLFLMLHFVFELQTSWDTPVLDRPGFCELFPVVFYSTQYLSPLLVLAFTVERYVSVALRFANIQRAIKNLQIACLAHRTRPKLKINENRN